MSEFSGNCSLNMLDPIYYPESLETRPHTFTHSRQHMPESFAGTCQDHQCPSDKKCFPSTMAICIDHGIRTCPFGWTASRESCYYNTGSSATFADARIMCSGLFNSSVLEVTSAEESSFLLSKGITYAWMGLNAINTAGVFVWPSGSDVMYENWSTAEACTGKCVILYDGVWHCRLCSVTWYAVCEMPIQRHLHIN